jgi:hypothetical protein
MVGVNTASEPIHQPKNDEARAVNEKLRVHIAKILKKLPRRDRQAAKLGEYGRVLIAVLS